MNHDLKAIKGMVGNADHLSEVAGIAAAWDSVHDELVGGKGDSGGGAYGDLDRAVSKVMAHWEGEAAQRFKKKAEHLLQQVRNGASHCTDVSEVLRNAAEDYRNAHDTVSKIEEPNWFDKAWDAITDGGGRDESITKEAVEKREIPKDLLAKADEGFIGAEKEKQLEAAHHMETLARNYVSYSNRLNEFDGRDSRGGIGPSNPQTPMPAPFPAPSVGGGQSAGPKKVVGGSTGPGGVAPAQSGITGGGLQAGKTRVDSLPSGITGGSNGAFPVGSGGAPGAGIGANGGTASDTPAGGGMFGGAGRGGSPAGRRVGPQAGGASPRPGMGGGMGAGAGGGRGGAAAAGRGPLARTKGGVAGTPRGITGGTPITQGGTGLGKGRNSGLGGAGRGTGGMLGARGANQQRPSDKKAESQERPDYLVEDEATWMPDDRRSVPRTIE